MAQKPERHAARAAAQDVPAAKDDMHPITGEILDAGPTLDEVVEQSPHVSQYSEERQMAERLAASLGLVVESAVESEAEYKPIMGTIVAEITGPVLECQSSTYFEDAARTIPSRFKAREIRLLQNSVIAPKQNPRTFVPMKAGTVLFLPLSIRIRGLEDDPIGRQFILHPPEIASTGEMVRTQAKNGNSFGNYKLYRIGVNKDARDAAKRNEQARASEQHRP